MSIRVLGTGIGWIGNGIESIESNIYELIKDSQNEIIIGTYSFGIGGIDIIKQIGNALKRKVEIELFINNYFSQPVIIQKELELLLKNNLNFKIYNFKPNGLGDLHAKIILSDRKKAIIGSSNLSRRGLIINHELAILIEDKEVSNIALAFDRLKLLNFVREVNINL